jgi:bis(5'-nucleosyl)-tetraphosphatase (symmetrical)
MALYAIGDVQGCFAALQRLLARLSFDPSRDRLWFTGDLVNRGPRSLDVLRFVARLGGNAVTVLGNHDLHLLAVAAGAASLRTGDTLDEVLSAPDRDELLQWLSHCPLLHYDDRRGVHQQRAGLLPAWDIETATRCAREVESLVQGPDTGEFYRNMYGNTPHRWDPALSKWDRARLIINTMTRLRFCTADGGADYSHKGPPGSQPPGLMPWFQHPQRRTRNSRVVFGHWSALGRYDRDGVVGLDTGCVWGRELTAIRLDPPTAFVSVPCSPRHPR